MCVRVCVCAEQARSFLLICAHASQTLIDNRWMNGRSRSPSPSRLVRVRFASARAELSRVRARAELSQSSPCAASALTSRRGNVNVKRANKTNKCLPQPTVESLKSRRRHSMSLSRFSLVRSQRARSRLSCSCNRAQGSA